MEEDGEVSELIANRRFQFRFMRHEGWENALFVHWPVDAMVLKAKLPNGLEPDILDGFAWIGLVLLTERGVSVTPAAGRKIAPKIDHFGANIRTYVRHKGIPGIFFFSLECSSYFATLGARLAGIPYFPARMRRTVDIECPLLTTEELALRGSGTSSTSQSSSRCFPSPVSNASSKVEDQKGSFSGADFIFEFSSERCNGGPTVSARWRLQCTGGASAGMEESDLVRARWFVERYSVYAAWPWGRGPLLLRGDVTHPSWPLQSATLDELDAEQLLAAAGFPELGLEVARSKDDHSSLNAPHICFSRGVGPVDFWMLEPP